MPQRSELEELADMVRGEVDADADAIAAQLMPEIYGGADVVEVSRDEHLAYLRRGFFQGGEIDGQQLPPDMWRLETAQRIGWATFWHDAHEAFGMKAPPVTEELLAQMSEGYSATNSEGDRATE